MDARMDSAIQLNQLGVETKRQGRWQEAASYYEEALRLAPKFAEAHYNLGLLWREQGNVAMALACFEQTLALRPDVAAARFELANLFLQMKDFDAAAREYELLVQFAPDFHAARFNLAIVHLERRMWRQAESVLREAIQSCPQDADAWASLGTALREQGSSQQAADAFHEAIRLDPNHAPALTNWGGILREQGRYEEAISFHQRAIAARPNLAEAYINLGNALHQLDRNGEALQAYQQATQLAPEREDSWLNIGHLLREMGDVQQARRVYHAVAQRRPKDPLNSLRRIATCPLVFNSRDELEEYRAEFLTTASALKDARLDMELPEILQVAPECPFNLQFLDGNLRPLKEAFAAVYSGYFARNTRPLEPRARTGKPRIGIVAITRWSTSFTEPFGGIAQHLDGRLFDITVICRQEMCTAVQRVLSGEHITILGIPDRFPEAVAAIRARQFDLLYYWEVGNNPVNYFLPFVRLAPTQMTSWAIQVTSGIPTIDVYLSSNWIEPENSADHYSERLIRGQTMLGYRYPVVLPKTRKLRQDFGFSAEHHLYGCLQNLGKFHPDFDGLLAGILQADPRARIVVAEDRAKVAVGVLRARFARTIPGVADRIVFQPSLQHSDYLSLLNVCDVLLDPPHFGGVSTTLDALALGKPLVTLPSGFQRGSYSSGLLRKIGVSELVARDSADYIRLAVEIASDREQNSHLAEKIRAAHPLVFQDQAAVVEHEQIFMQLIEKSRATQRG